MMEVEPFILFQQLLFPFMTLFMSACLFVYICILCRHVCMYIRICLVYENYTSTDTRSLAFHLSLAYVRYVSVYIHSLFLKKRNLSVMLL